MANSTRRAKQPEKTLLEGPVPALYRLCAIASYCEKELTLRGYPTGSLQPLLEVSKVISNREGVFFGFTEHYKVVCVSHHCSLSAACSLGVVSYPKGSLHAMQCNVQQ